MRTGLHPVLAVLTLVAACAPRVPPAPIAVRDGEVLAKDRPVRLALVGGFAAAGPAVIEDLRAANPAVVVLAGDAVQRGTPRAHRELRARLGPLPVLPMPGAGEARRDPRLRTWRTAWSGLGSRETDRPVSWRSFAVEAAGHRWRVVVLDADHRRLGDRFADETFWVPRVCRTDDAPLIVLMNHPIDGEDDADEASGARTLHELVRRHTDPTRLALVAAAGPGAPALSLPGGRWGEGWLAVGRAGAAPRDEPGADGDPQAPTVGWWLLELDGPSLRLTLRAPTGASDPAWTSAHTFTWTRDGGWTP